MTDLESILGYEFRDGRLLQRALVHSSFGGESSLQNNETLEFLGDAVLDLVLSELMMKEHPDYNEGALTQLRAALVNSTHLANLARELGLGPHVRLGRGEEQSGGREKERILASCYEAILGAIFLDAGYEAVRSVAVKHFKDTVRSPSTVREDFKTRLQEHTQRVQKITPSYRVTKITGPDHDRCYHVELHLGDEILASGRGRSRKHAEQEAAEAALARLTADESRDDS